jgi:hypothetical protein
MPTISACFCRGRYEIGPYDMVVVRWTGRRLTEEISETNIGDRRSKN